MKSRSHDPLRLDMAAFAADGGELAGAWAGADLARLAELQAPPQDVALAEVRWSARGQLRPVTGGEPELWLELAAETSAWLTCQRCQQPMTEPLAVDTRIRFVRGEAQAEALDGEEEYDVLALARSLDLRTLVEDELLLALPIVPRHEACPQPLAAPAEPEAADDEPAPRENPFAALAALRGKGG